MKILFCPTSHDIHMTITREEYDKIKWSEGYIPSIYTKHDSRTFYLTNSPFMWDTPPRDGIKVVVPRDPNGDYFVRITDQKYEEFLNQGIGTRYDSSSEVGSSKIHIAIEN